MKVFDDVYEKNRWGGGESRSGPGAGSIAVTQLAPLLKELVNRLGVQSVLDVGCGDGFWMPDLPGYIGIDVSTKTIEASRQRHPGREYLIDSGDPYPKCELAIVRCVMQHLPYDEGLALLDRVRDAGVTWLLATTYTEGELNVDVGYSGSHGYWIDLTAGPFHLGQPVESLVDHGASTEHGGVLGLWKLR